MQLRQRIHGHGHGYRRDMQEMDKIYGDDGKVRKELNNKQI